MSQITKDALKHSFMELLEENTLDAIKVKDIVGRCNMNRNTFYYHFHDVYELMDYVFTSEAQSLIELNQFTEKWKESFNRICQYLLTHKKMIYHVYYSINREQLEKYLYEVVSDLLIKVIKNEVKDKQISDKTCQILCDFFKYALVGMFLEWIKEGMQEEIDDIIYKIELVFDGSMEHILLNCEGK